MNAFWGSENVCDGFRQFEKKNVSALHVLISIFSTKNKVSNCNASKKKREEPPMKESRVLM